MKKLEPIAYWWNGGQDIYQVNSRCYVLNGWNGEWWLSCWEVAPDDLYEIIGSDIQIRPIYRYEAEDIDLDKIDEESDDWDHAVELVDLDIH